MPAPRAARLCKTCPFRRAAPKAGEPGGSVPDHDPEEMPAVVRDVTEGFHVMQCHDSVGEDPRPCAGFLSVVGYDSIGVRLAAMRGIIRHQDVGRPIKGLYGSFREMLLEADHLDIPCAETRGRRKDLSPPARPPRGPGAGS